MMLFAAVISLIAVFCTSRLIFRPADPITKWANITQATVTHKGEFICKEIITNDVLHCFVIGCVVV